MNRTNQSAPNFKYTSGSFSVTPFAPSESSPFTSPGYSIQLVGNGPDKSRQEQAHAHQVVIHPKYGELLVPDLGADIVRRYKKNAEGRWTFQGHIGFESGGGPRHIAFYGTPSVFSLLMNYDANLRMGRRRSLHSLGAFE